MSTLLEKASLVIIPSGYEEGIVYPQIPENGNGDLTFTRASNGTRINSAGLVEVCPWNLLGNSEDGTSGKWGNPFNISSVTLNSTTAPNGTNTGNLVVENSANSRHWFEQSFSAINGTPYTISVYFKAKERTQCALYAFTDNFVFAGQVVIFNLSTGAIVSQSGTQTNSIENVGNGWYRCAMTVTANASATAYFGYGLANGGSTSYQGDGTSGLYMWGRQLNTSTLKPYFPTTDRLNVPRLTYQNGGGGCPSLLLEKQSTNLLSYSEQFDNAGWTKLGSSITANSTTSPDGTQNADSIIDNTTNSRHVIEQPITGDLSISRAMSLYAKQNTLRYLYMSVTNAGDSHCYSAIFDLQSGTVSATKVNGSATINASIESVGNGWYRCTITGTMTSGTATFYPLIGTSDRGGFTGTLVNNNAPSYAGSGQSLYIYGAQLEASSYATSYIPTTSSSATRVADACYKTGISSLIGQTEGALFADLKITELPTDGSLFGVQKTASNFVIRFGSQGSNIYAQCYNGSTNLFFETTSYTLGTRIKLAFAYKAGSYAFYINGTQIATGTNATSIPACDEVMTNSLWGNTNPSLYEINQAILFPTRLTNAELASLTTI